MAQSLSRSAKQKIRDERKYEKFQRVLDRMHGKIDNSAPVLPTCLYYNSGDLAQDANRLNHLEHENRQIVKNINTIYRTHGKIDNGPPSLLKFTNYYDRLHRNKNIDRENRKIYKNLKKVEPSYKYKNFEREYQYNLDKVIFGSNYPEFYDTYLIPKLEQWDIINPLVPYPSLIPEGEPKRVRCFLDVGVEEKDKLRKLGRMLIEVYRDYAPKQSDHFLNLVNGFNDLSYKNSPFHRIQKGFACVAGDVTKKTGLGVYSIFDECYPNENNYLQFKGPGVVSSFSLKTGHNHSQFLISFRKLDVLNKEFTVFGRVIKCLGTLQRIEEFGSSSGSPIKRVIITNCGIYGNKDFLNDTLDRYPKLNLGQRLTKRMKAEREKLALKSGCGCNLYKLIPDEDEEEEEEEEVDEEASSDDDQGDSEEVDDGNKNAPDIKDNLSPSKKEIITNCLFANRDEMEGYQGQNFEEIDVCHCLKGEKPLEAYKTICRCNY